MRAFLQDPMVSRREMASRQELDAVGGAEGQTSIRFVPAGWLVLALSVLRLLLGGARLSKLGIAGIAWSLMPRTLKMVAAGLVLAATIVVMGAMAALALLAVQFT